MLDVVYSQSVLPFSYRIAVPSAHEAPPARLMRIFQCCALSKKSANDNNLRGRLFHFRKVGTPVKGAG
jgi:hypothetical protein